MQEPHAVPQGLGSASSVGWIWSKIPTAVPSRHFLVNNNTQFEETPYSDVLACREGDLLVTVAVLPVPAEGFGMTLDDLQLLIDDDVVAHGAALCIGRALLSRADLPSHLRFDVVSVCANPEARRVRVHHVRGAWQS